MPLTKEQEKVLIPNEVTINWDKYKKDVYEELKKIEIKVNNNPILYKINKDEEDSYNSLLDILFKEGFNQNISKYVKQSLNVYIRNIIIVLICDYIYNNFFIKISINNQLINVIIHAILISVLCIILISTLEEKK